MIGNFLKSAFLGLLAFSLCACSDDDSVKKLITFHSGSERANALASNRTLEVMPISTVSVMTDTNHFMYNGDLQKVHVAEVTLPDGKPMRGFYFICNSRGAKRLFQATASNIGGYIVVKYDGNVIGLRRIDMPINDGKIFVTPEIPLEDDLQKLVDEMNMAIETINEIKDEVNSW